MKKYFDDLKKLHVSYLLLCSIFIALIILIGCSKEIKSTPQTKVVNQSTDEVKVYNIKTVEGITYYADNPNIAPVSIYVNFLKLQNIEVMTSLPFYTTLKSKVKKQFLFKMKRKSKQSTAFQIRIGQMIGDINAIHDNGFEYTIPYEHGKKYKMYQGYFTNSTHKNTYALDFALPLGSKVVAARGGVVIDYKEDNSGPCTGGIEVCSAYSNFVSILHGDNTIGNYAHLKKNGVIVKMGELVKEGQVIALSGTTGTKGPHLHFEVFRPGFFSTGDKGRLKANSIPTVFLTHTGDVSPLTQGLYYYSKHKSSPAFPVSFGTDITDADWENSSSKVPTDNKCIIEEKKVDDTVLFFAKNGKKWPVKVSINFSLTNMRASKELPFEKMVPPNEKVYLLLIKGDPNENYYSRTRSTSMTTYKPEKE